MKCAAQVLVLVCGLLSACASYGPVGVDPDRSFSGLRDIVANLPDDGVLDIFLVHGMRADRRQRYRAVIERISRKLNLRKYKPTKDKRTGGGAVYLASAAPPISLDGVSIFDSKNWHTFQPRFTIRSFTVNGTTKRVNFYRFEYWKALAYMKCAFIIGPDTRVVGTSSRSEFCNQPPYNVASGKRLSASSEFGNRWIKTEIMEWGLADAVIATSSYRIVLRQAVREMTARALSRVMSRDVSRSGVDERKLTGAMELRRLAASGRARFVFITESLGSYVVHDALAQALSETPSAVAERAMMQPNARARMLEAIAPVAVICGASQVDMFANQLALLRFSEISLGPPKPTAVENTSHFFRGCPSANRQGNLSPGGIEFAARQVVAYHEPNDLLTYYTSDLPGEVGVANRNTINVVVPFTTKWIWFLAADPVQAHTGQPEVRRIMDMVVCGRRVGQKIACRSK